MSSATGIEAVVIPAHNEARTIRAVAAGALQHVPLVIVVDDASTDGTAEVLDGLPVGVLRNAQNCGKAASLLRGAGAAIERGAGAIVTLDGDGQHCPEDIPSLVRTYRAMPGGIVIGARLHHRARMPPSRYWANRVANFWISLASGYPIADTQSGFRVYPAHLLQTANVGSGRAHSFVFESEILIEAARHAVIATCVPISVVYSDRARASYFRPVVDVARIVRMVAWRLLREGTLLRALDPRRRTGKNAATP
jgi:glycosyltransferase involved in cell wall biosynthesis